MPDRATAGGPGGARPAWIDLAISVLNGALGDALHARRNGLEIPMAFHDDRGPIALDRNGLVDAIPAPTGKLCILCTGSASTSDSGGIPRIPPSTMDGCCSAISRSRRSTMLCPMSVSSSTCSG